jgi:hypothetical protein
MSDTPRTDALAKQIGRIYASANNPNDFAVRVQALVDDVCGQLERENAELVKDKERLDWLCNNKVAINRLKERDKRFEYWHIYWTPSGQELGGCIHSGSQAEDFKNLRQAIDAAITATKGTK